MSKPVIGVMPQYDTGSSRIMIVPDFFNAVREAGGVPVLLPLENNPADVAEILDRLDGFLYPGGPDINPLLFGEETLPECGNIIPQRDRVELELMPEILKTKKPVLGICRGIQSMNVALGGTLIQDIPAQVKSKVRIGHYQKAGNPVRTHLVRVVKDTLLYDIVKKDTLQVNSFHHQSCRELGRGVVLDASAADGVVEAISLAEHPFFLGLQWHPEHLFSNDEDTMKIWKAFVSSCK